MRIKNNFNKLLIIIASCVSIYLCIVHIQNYNLVKLLMSITIIPLMILPYFLNSILKYRLIDGIILVYQIFVTFSLILGSLFNFYDIIPLYDKNLHFITGILTSILAIIVLINFDKYHENNTGFNFIFMVAITALVALLWEVFEYIFDYIFSGNAQRLETGVNDTMQDMIASLLGFIVFAILYLINKRKFKATKLVEEVEVNEGQGTD